MNRSLKKSEVLDTRKTKTYPIDDFIDPKEVLSRTHNGFLIYKHVLKKYYPEISFKLSGRHCEPVKNPFNHNKPTLWIGIVNEEARHNDYESTIPSGSVLDFAELHYKVKGQVLYRLLNEEMSLRIHKGHSSRSRYETLVNKDKADIPVFSFFTKPIFNTKSNAEVDLLRTYHLIRGSAYQDITKELRLLKNPKDVKGCKVLDLDYVTFSGTFYKRRDENLIRHSGLLVLDFDDVEDVAGLKSKLLNDRYFETELLFTSPSGKGLKWVVPIDLSQGSHQECFKGISKYLSETYSIKVDPSGKDISRPCYLCHDPNVFINPKYLRS